MNPGQAFVPVETVTRSLLSAALDLAARRHEVSASNIANAATEGFVPQRLGFQSHVEQARDEWRRDGRVASGTAESLRAMPPSLASLDPAGWRIDTQMAEMARNSMHYQALIQGVSRHMALLALAASDGRR